jgi:uncharacterized protein YndB with AHSA1/START domain
MKKALVVLVVLVGVLVAVIATRPDTFHIERSAVIQAPAPVVFANLDDFHQWPQWSPWEGRDPQMMREYEGAESGVGAAYHWSGNDEVGEGRMTITESAPPSRLGIRLDFLKPFAATNQCAFTLEPADAGTRVTWTMDGNADFMTKAMTLVMSMDRMVGKDFEQGLAALKTVSEREAVGAAPAGGTPALADTAAVSG